MGEVICLYCIAMISVNIAECRSKSAVSVNWFCLIFIIINFLIISYKSYN